MLTHSACRRFVGVLMLMFGIIGMHSLVVSPGRAVAAAPEVVMHHQSPAPIAVDACDCSGHHGFHACVFIITALVGLAGLLLVCWIVDAADGRVPARVRELLRRRQRAPPWTVLTLPELCLLRI